MSTRLTIQDALKRVHLNTVTLKNEENERFIRALKNHIKPRNLITNFSEKVHEQHVRDFLLDAFYKGEHYIGKKDKIIPYQLTLESVDKSNYVIIEDATHNSGFENLQSKF